MRPNVLDVAIIGAGIGGLSAAVALQRVGIRAQVFEQATELRETGAGIHLAPNGSRILDHWGLTDRLTAQAGAVRPELLEVRAYDTGQILARQPMGHAWTEKFNGAHHTLHRADLHRLLLDQLPPDQIHLGHRYTGHTQHTHRVTVHFHNHTSHHCHALIGADGVHSRLRAQHAGTDHPVHAGTAALRGVVPATHTPDLPTDRLYIWAGPTARLLVCPTAAGRDLAFVAIVPEPTPTGNESWSRTTTPQALLQALPGIDPQAHTLLAATHEVGHWSLFDREPLTTWTHGRTTLLGDAAHPILPHHGQGASQALEDAVALAHHLAHLDHPNHVHDALLAYEHLRLPHTTDVHAATRSGGTQHLTNRQQPTTPHTTQSARVQAMTQQADATQSYDIHTHLPHPHNPKGI